MNLILFYTSVDETIHIITNDTEICSWLFSGEWKCTKNLSLLHSHISHFKFDENLALLCGTAVAPDLNQALYPGHTN